jgi:hypothetical protein
MKRLPSELVALVALLVAADRAAADPSLARESRRVPAFHAIELAGVLAAEVAVGRPASVDIVGETGLLAQVRTEVVDGVLVISTRGKLPRQHQLRAIIGVPDLDALGLSGTGALAAHGVHNARLAIHLAGTGAIAVDGATDALRVVLDGTGQIDAEQLAAKAVTVDVSGTGNAALRATGSLDARVTGTGSIDVEGKPARVVRHVTGVGSINVQ